MYCPILYCMSISYVYIMFLFHLDLDIYINYCVIIKHWGIARKFVSILDILQPNRRSFVRIG